MNDDVVVEGRSYYVIAPTADLARPVARQMAQRRGHRDAATASVLWIERIGIVRGYPLYEVVLEVSATPPAGR